MAFQILPDSLSDAIGDWITTNRPEAIDAIAQGRAELPDMPAKELRRMATSHPDWPTIMRATGINSGSLTKADAAAIVFACGEAEATREAPEAEAEAEAEAPAETKPAPEASTGPTPDERAGTLLQDVFGALGRGDFAAPRKTLADLIRDLEDAKQAAKDAAANAKPANHPAPGDRVTGDVQPVRQITLGELAPKAVANVLPGRTAGLSVTIYDGDTTPDALFSPDPAALAALAACDQSAANVWLYGPAGTGKSSLPEWYAAKTGRPFFRVAFDRSTEPEDLIGGIEPDGAGGMAWRDGVLSRAIRQPGAVVLLDEPTFARPAALAMLQTLLDGGRQLLTRATGEVIRAAPGVLFIAADNTSGTGDETGQYAGTSGMNRALLDRFAARVFVGYMPEDKEAAILAKRTNVPANVANAMVGFAWRTRRAADAGDMAHALGLRRLIAWATLAAAGLPSEQAFASACVAGEAPDDEEPLRQMERAHLDHAAIDRALDA